MLNLIYDTLFNNKQYEQFDAGKAINAVCDYSENVIEFDYNGKKFILKVIEEE